MNHVIFFALIFMQSVVSQPGDIPSRVQAFGKFSYPIVQQNGNFLWVSEEEDVVTYYAPPLDEYAALGLLAHDYLAGESFYSLNREDLIEVFFEDGGVAFYKVEKIKRYFRYSSWIDQKTGKVLTEYEVFVEIYGQPDRLVLQTCVPDGVMFVIARYIENEQNSDDFGFGPTRQRLLRHRLQPV